MASENELMLPLKGVITPNVTDTQNNSIIFVGVNAVI